MTILLVVLSFIPAALCIVLWFHFIYVIRTLLAIPHRRPVFSRTASADLPAISVLVPLFNEGDIARPLAHSLARVNYPRKKIEVLFLDDSDELDSRRATEGCRQVLMQSGIKTRILHRKVRRGWKAGALNDGLEVARNPLVFILDADFTVEPGIFRELVPELLQFPRLGFVQCRWGFRNADLNWLTRAQQILWHNIIHAEQTYRHRRGFMVNFNGTAALFRRECITSVGGLNESMLTEDLDLTVRTRIAGWKGSYRQDIVCDSLLPHTLPIFFSQQFRWAYGLFQVAKKRLPSILRAPLALGEKSAAVVQLVSLALYPAIVALFGVGVVASSFAGTHVVLTVVSIVIGVNMVLAGLYWLLVARILGLSAHGSSIMVAVLSGSIAPLTVRALVAALAGLPCTFERTEKRTGVPYETGVHPFDTFVALIIIAFAVTVFAQWNPVSLLVLPYVPGSFASVFTQRRKQGLPWMAERRRGFRSMRTIRSSTADLEIGTKRMHGRILEVSETGAVLETGLDVPAAGAFGVIVFDSARRAARIARTRPGLRRKNRVTVEFDMIPLSVADGGKSDR